MVKLSEEEKADLERFNALREKIFRTPEDERELATLEVRLGL